MYQEISFVFQAGSSFLDEKQFAQRLSEKNIDVIDEAKSVIDAWCAGLRDHNILCAGNDEGAGPLAYLLEYIADRDANCSQLLRAYCIVRDGEHENYSRDSVTAAYLARMDFTYPAHFALAIFLVLLYGRDGAGFGRDGGPISTWEHFGILSRARESLMPEAFADLVTEELVEFASHPDIFAAFGTHEEACKYAREDLLNQLGDNSWDIEFKNAFISMNPINQGPWGGS